MELKDLKKGLKLDKMGMYSQDTAELFFLLIAGFQKVIYLVKKTRVFFMLMEKLQQERLICAIGALAASEFILNTTIQFAKK